jgi:hypothetical protein
MLLAALSYQRGNGTRLHWTDIEADDQMDSLVVHSTNELAE